MTQGHLTLFTSEKPDRLGKLFSLDHAGKLTKETAGQMTRGRYEVQPFSTALELASVLQSVQTDQAISSSLPLNGNASGVVVAEKLLAQNPGAVCRSKRYFGLPGVQGLMTLDYDPQEGMAPMQPEALWQALLAVAPDLAGAGVVHWHSGSSFIFHGDKELKGLGGQRVYVMIQSLADMPRALACLNKRLWLAGIGGHIKVSSSGSLLVRSLFDQAMGDAGARLDFIGGAVCLPPLEQRRGQPSVLADGGFIDTRTAIPELTSEEEAAYVALVESAKARAMPEAQAKREAWKAEHVQKAVTHAAGAGADLEGAKARAEHTLSAALGGTLLGGWGLIHVDDKGAEHPVTVDQVLKDRERWHLCRFLSPLEPDHRGRVADAILYARQPVPVLFDLNDGGVAYRLAPQPVSFEIRRGGRAQLAADIADHLAQADDLLVSAGTLVLAVSGRFAVVDRPMLSYLIGTRCHMVQHGKDRPNAVDVPQELADMARSLLLHRARVVAGRVTMPLIDPAGRVIDRPGLDDDTGIFLDIEPGAWPSPPAEPSRAQVVTALRRLWQPWSAYRWASADDRAAMLAAVLTIPLRPTIDAAPGLFSDAPVQSSGKSKAVGAVAAVAAGRKVAPKPWVSGNEGEVDKWLLAVARSGEPAVVLDNVIGTFQSAALASTMAEGQVTGRLLGQNETLTPAARTLWLASGNNASLDRDMATRWLRARIDTGTESPQALAYRFDPVEAALSDRPGIVQAALTVHRAWHAAGCPRADAISTRFATWGRTIRHMTLWLAQSGVAAEAGIGELGDPAASILNESAVSDPESDALGLLLYGLSERLGHAEPFNPGEVQRLYQQAENSGDEALCAIRQGLDGLMPRARFGVTARAIGAALKNRRDRIVFGMKLKEVPQSGSAAARGSLWCVVSG